MLDTTRTRTNFTPVVTIVDWLILQFRGFQNDWLSAREWHKCNLYILVCKKLVPFIAFSYRQTTDRQTSRQTSKIIFSMSQFVVILGEFRLCDQYFWHTANYHITEQTVQFQCRRLLAFINTSPVPLLQRGDSERKSPTWGNPRRTLPKFSWVVTEITRWDGTWRSPALNLRMITQHEFPIEYLANKI